MSSKTTLAQEIKKGLWKDNPVLGLMLGLCPVLAVTTTAFNGLGMGVSTTFVLICSNIIIAILRPIIPKSVRIPVFIVVIATFVSILDLFLKAYAFELSRSLGLFVPLIVVNCIILGRAEAFAYHHGVLDSILDALGKALGFTLALGLMGAIRELFSAGTIFGAALTPAGFREAPVLFMIFSPGAFLLIGILKAVINRLFAGREK
jgi:electron transport complex protein RnfE